MNYTHAGRKNDISTVESFQHFGRHLLGDSLKYKVSLQLNCSRGEKGRVLEKQSFERKKERKRKERGFGALHMAKIGNYKR